MKFEYHNSPTILCLESIDQHEALEVSLRLHLAKRAKLTKRRPLIPKLPLIFSLHTLVHLILKILKCPFTLPQRNLIWILTIFFQTFTSIFKIDKKNIGITLSTNLRTTTLPQANKLMFPKMKPLRDQRNY